jgi:hypothetical protein
MSEQHAPANDQVAAQREQVIQRVTNGPQNFWDVRDADSWGKRQAFTTHNVYIANTMVAAYDRDEDSIVGEVTALITERDTLLYTLGRDGGFNGVDQYLAGRIAGIEFALGLVGVKFA